MDSLCLSNTFCLYPNLNFQILIQITDDRFCFVSFLRGFMPFTHDNWFSILPMLMKWLTCKTYVWEEFGTVLAGYEIRLTLFMAFFTLFRRDSQHSVLTGSLSVIPQNMQPSSHLAWPCCGWQKPTISGRNSVVSRLHVNR